MKVILITIVLVVNLLTPALADELVQIETNDDITPNDIVIDEEGDEMEAMLKQKVADELHHYNTVKAISEMMSTSLQLELDQLFNDSTDVLREFSQRNIHLINNDNRTFSVCNGQFNVNFTIERGIRRLERCRELHFSKPINLTDTIKTELIDLRRSIKNISVFIEHCHCEGGAEELKAWDYNEGYKKRRTIQTLLNNIYKKLFIRLLRVLEKINETNKCCGGQVERTKKLLTSVSNKFQVCLLITGNNGDLIDSGNVGDNYDYSMY